jgi:5-methylcytosine-specific restriction endonuclease McrA
MNYSEKLKDPRWQSRRFEIFNRDDFECRRCYSANDILNVHHLRYFTGLEPGEYSDKDLTTLCQPCHEAVYRLDLPEEEINNPWITYERMKKKIPVDLSPYGYEGVVFELCNILSL